MHSKHDFFSKVYFNEFHTANCVIRKRIQLKKKHTIYNMSHNQMILIRIYEWYLKKRGYDKFNQLDVLIWLL